MPKRNLRGHLENRGKKGEKKISVSKLFSLGLGKKISVFSVSEYVRVRVLVRELVVYLVWFW